MWGGPQHSSRSKMPPPRGFWALRLSAGSGPSLGMRGGEEQAPAAGLPHPQHRAQGGAGANTPLWPASPRLRLPWAHAGHSTPCTTARDPQLPPTQALMPGSALLLPPAPSQACLSPQSLAANQGPGVPALSPPTLPARLRPAWGWSCGAAGASLCLRSRRDCATSAPLQAWPCPAQGGPAPCDLTTCGNVTNDQC